MHFIIETYWHEFRALILVTLFKYHKMFENVFLEITFFLTGLYAIYINPFPYFFQHQTDPSKLFVYRLYEPLVNLEYLVTTKVVGDLYTVILFILWA
jgi:hypothetical protein